MYTLLYHNKKPYRGNTKLIIIPLLTDPSWLGTSRIYVGIFSLLMHYISVALYLCIHLWIFLVSCSINELVGNMYRIVLHLITV